LQFVCFFCIEIAVEKHFDPRNVTSGGASGGLKFFSRLAIAHHLSQPLINCTVIQPLIISLLNILTENQHPLHVIYFLHHFNIRVALI